MAEEIKKEEILEEKNDSPVNSKPKNFIKQLLDPQNKEQIEMTDENGEIVHFEQVAIVPREDKVYVILKPVEEMDGVKDDEALVFEIAEEEVEEGIKQHYLKLIENEVDIDIVFEQYYDMLRDAGVDLESEDEENK